LLKWLVDPLGEAPAEVKCVLRGMLLSSPGAIMVGVLEGLIVSGVALRLNHGAIFAVFLSLELACGVLRFRVVRLISRRRAAGQPQRIDVAVAMSMLWCTLQGSVSFFAMRTNIPTLQILSATMIMAVIGPLCARNYPAPRLAFLLVLLCDLPFVLGASLSGRIWLLILVPMTLLFLFGVWQITINLQRMAMASLCAELDSRYRANHDSLTGLKNRLAFNEMITVLPTEQKGTFALLCLDLDGFKAVNDTLGHDAGDRLLAAVAERLKRGIRETDGAFRMGGDEFIILVKGLSAEDIGPMAQRIIEQVSHQDYRFAGLPPIRIGISIGFACCPEDGRDIAELLRRADLALYASKSAGKGVQTRFGAGGAGQVRAVV
jgi:diguanylate cyclase (GGDEF)-like protein